MTSSFLVAGIPTTRHSTPDLYTEYELAYHAEKDSLLRKTKTLHWFAEFSEGVMGCVREPSPAVVNALIDAIAQWLKEPTRTA